MEFDQLPKIFNKTPQQLTIEESATLVGMLKNSSLYNPIRRPNRVGARRDIVFRQMQEEQIYNISRTRLFVKITVNYKFYS